MKTITFNTKRPYSAEGQIITATVDGSMIKFDDETRCIRGTIEYPNAGELSDSSIISVVMRSYDRNEYTER